MRRFTIILMLALLIGTAQARNTTIGFNPDRIGKVGGGVKTNTAIIGRAAYFSDLSDIDHHIPVSGQ